MKFAFPPIALTPKPSAREWNGLVEAEIQGL